MSQVLQEKGDRGQVVALVAESSPGQTPAFNVQILYGKQQDCPYLRIGQTYFTSDSLLMIVGTSGGNEVASSVPKALSGLFADLPNLDLGVVYWATDTKQLYIGDLTGSRLIAPSAISDVDMGTF